jgi:hypothetical protein
MKISSFSCVTGERQSSTWIDRGSERTESSRIPSLGVLSLDVLGGEGDWTSGEVCGCIRTAGAVCSTGVGASASFVYG